MGKLMRFLDKIGKMPSKRKDALSIPEANLFGSEDRQKKTGWTTPTYTQSQTVHIREQVCLDNRCVSLLPKAIETDAYRVLRTRILQKAKLDGGNTIMITSVLPGEGKTLTAVNLSIIMAKDYRQTVLLVDCDLRKQSVHQVLGIWSDKGLIDYLLDDVPLSDLMMWPGIEKLTLVSGGRPFYESSELLGSPRMKELVADMKSRYTDRYVLFDAPPVLAGADALALIPLVDHVLLVVEADKTPAEDIVKAVELIPKEKMLGVVLNKLKDRVDTHYGYALYGHG
jgi:protein-tyrosine kinase